MQSYKGKKLVLYCNCTALGDSFSEGVDLEHHGLNSTSLYILQGGIQAWEKAGYQVEPDPNVCTGTEYRAIACSSYK